jgi:hypothetical protein
MSPHFHTQTQTLTPASLPPCLPARKRKPSGGSEVPATTFADVAGMNAAKRELAEVRGLQLMCHPCICIISMSHASLVGCAIRAGAGAGVGLLDEPYHLYICDWLCNPGWGWGWGWG